MGVKVATHCLHFSQPLVPQSPSSSQTLASAVSSPSSKRRSRTETAPLIWRFDKKLDRSSLFGTRIHRSRSFEYPRPKPETRVVKRACSANLGSFSSDEEFSRKIQELAMRFQLSSGNEDEDGDWDEADSGSISDPDVTNGHNISSSADVMDSYSEKEFSVNSSLDQRFNLDSVELNWLETREEEALDWQDETIPASIERKANSVDIPLSLRMIKRKIQWQDGFREAGESAYCSLKKAFSSMVFIIRELHSYTLQMREVMLYEDLQGILARVQKEMHASFVWLFQQVFSHTPTLMVYVMILLANYSVYSMGSNTAFAAMSLSPGSCSVATESVALVDVQDNKLTQKFDSSNVKSFSFPSSSGKSASIGGNNGGGGGGKPRPVASGTDGEGQFDRFDHFRTILPDGTLSLSLTMSGDVESVSGQDIGEEEIVVWNSIVDEASRMQAASRDEALDHETMQRFVSPVTAKIEADDYADYVKTDLLYRIGLAHDPNNSLLLANYAQFLFLVVHDYGRAEEYFKKAIAMESPDAEAYNKYATFLWRARNDLWAAEETYLEAISADPTNSFYASNYAHFLWNTGGEDTCFPLSSPDQTNTNTQDA